MNFDSFVPCRKISLSPPSSTPANSDFLNASTDRMPSSMLPWPTKLTTCTPRDWPMRCTRPMRCSSTAGFHGMSMFTTTAAACCRFRPTPPASVDRNRRHCGSAWNCSTSAPRWSPGTLPLNSTWPQARWPLPGPRRRRISSCVPSHWLNTTAFAAGSSSRSSSTVISSSTLWPWSVSWSSSQVLLQAMRMFCSAHCRRRWSASDR